MNEEKIWEKYHNGELIIEDYKITAEPESADDLRNRRAPIINVYVKFAPSVARSQNL